MKPVEVSRVLPKPLEVIMAKKSFFVGMLAKVTIVTLALVFGMVLAGCSDDVVPYSFTAGNVTNANAQDAPIVFSNVSFYVVPAGTATSSIKKTAKREDLTSFGTPRASINNGDVGSMLIAVEFTGATGPSTALMFGTIPSIGRVPGKNIVVALAAAPTS
jgi:hypothetical protein